MTECINVYSATQSIARSLLSCDVRLFVTTMYRNGQTYYQTFHHFSFPKGDPTVKFRRGHPNRGGVPKICNFHQYFRNTDTEVFQNTDTEYRTDMKKIPTKISNTDTDSKYRYRPSSSQWLIFSVYIEVYIEVLMKCPVLTYCRLLT